MSSSFDHDRVPQDRPVSRIRTVLICAVILAAAVAVAAVTFLTEPTAKRGGATRETAMLVEVTPVERGTYRPVIVATGMVEPAREVTLSAQVGGEIIARAPEMVPGGVVEKGQVLLRIEPADFRHALKQRESELGQAIAALDIERGRQQVAQSDFELLEGTVPQGDRSLVLREPQLEAAEVRVEAARAAVEQARLDLARSRIEAPFAAQVLSREADVGSRVTPGEPLGRLVGLEAYWVAVTVPLPKLRWISVPGVEEDQGAEVEVRNRTAWPEGVTRRGHVFKLVGALDGATRMARVLVEIQDPLGRLTEPGTEVPPLMIGEFLEVRIQGTELPEVIRLHRDHVRADNTAWVMEDGVLRIRDLDIIMRDSEYAYLRSGLEDGDQVVTTNLATVTDGAPLRLEGGERAPE